MTELPPLEAVWLPLWEADITAVQCGVWWDVIRVPEAPGRRAIDLLGEEKRRNGPVIIDPSADDPRLYFFVPRGTADSWRLQGTIALGERAHVVVPLLRHVDGHRIHWLIPPTSSRLFIEPDQLRRTLLTAASLVRPRP